MQWDNDALVPRILYDNGEASGQFLYYFLSIPPRLHWKLNNVTIAIKNVCIVTKGKPQLGEALGIAASSEVCQHGSTATAGGSLLE